MSTDPTKESFETKTRSLIEDLRVENEASERRCKFIEETWTQAAIDQIDPRHLREVLALGFETKVRGLACEIAEMRRLIRRLRRITKEE